MEEVENILKSGEINMDDEQVEETALKIRHLIELWLDSFEREIFEGKTLEELLESSIL